MKTFRLKMTLIILTILFSNASHAQQDVEVYATLKARIKNSCISGMSSLPRSERLDNYRQVCECIAAHHISHTKSKSDKKYELERLDWTAKFYEMKDVRELEKMVNAKPFFSEFDSKIAEKCSTHQ